MFLKKKLKSFSETNKPQSQLTDHLKKPSSALFVKHIKPGLYLILTLTSSNRQGNICGGCYMIKNKKKQSEK